MKYQLQKELFETLNNISGGSFYRKGTTEHIFENLKYEDRFLDADKKIIYPHLILSGANNNGHISLEIFPIISEIEGKKEIKTKENTITELKGILRIINKKDKYYSEGFITDYWNGILWISKPTIITNMEDYRKCGEFIFR